MREVRSFVLGGSDRQVLDPAGVHLAEVIDAGLDHHGAMVAWAVVDTEAAARRPWTVWMIETGRPVPARARYVATITLEPSLPVSRAGRTVHVFVRRSRLGGGGLLAAFRTLGVR